MTALTPTSQACADVRDWQAKRGTTNIQPLNLALGLSAVREGLAAIDHGQNEAGYRLIEHGADYLQKFLPDINSRLASEIGTAADNMRRKAGGA